MKITIFGTWYVGLVTGTCLAEVGHEVMCIDIDEQKIENLNKWIIPIYEPGLSELVEQNLKKWWLQFSSDPKEWVAFSPVIISAVGTPPDENHRADLQYVRAVAKTVGEHMTQDTFFINKSTVPVGTGKICENIIKNELQNRKTDIQIHIISNPEFLREGTAIKDTMLPERIVCWVSDEPSKKIMQEIYAPFSRSYSNKIIWTDVPSAEVAKYAANAFLATKISFINEIANFCEVSWANVMDVAKSIGSDSRIGPKFLHAGIGYGGSCFPKDVDALIETGKDVGYDFKIIQATEEVNKSQKYKLIEKLEKYVSLPWATITIWGLSFKPKTSDLRDAPSRIIIEKLLQKWVGKIQVYDPVAMPEAREIYAGNEQIIFSKNALEAVNKSDGLLLVTEWDEFRGIDKKNMLEKMAGNTIIDGRNIWKKEDFAHLWANYEGIWIW